VAHALVLAEAVVTTAPVKRKIRVRFRARFNPGQLRAWSSEELWTAYLGGWGAGKTWFGARALLRNVLRNPRGTDALIAAPFWSTVKRTTLREFKSVVPAGMITDESRGERYIEVVGRRVYYGSADRPETLDGQTVGAVWLDEARYVKRRGWEVILSRLRSKRARVLRGVITSTPGGDWLEDEFNTGKAGRAAIHASTRENRRNLGDGVVENMEASLSKRAARVFIDGEFGLLEGAVYEFEKSWHLIPWRYNPQLPVVVAWDFGYQRPAVVFLQPIPAGHPLPPAKGTVVQRRAPFGTWVAFDELVPDGVTTEMLALQVRQKGYRVTRIWCDPAGDGTQTATGLTDVQMLRSAGFQDIKFTTDPRWRHIPTGVRLLEGLLRNTKLETRLYVAEHLDKPAAKRGVVKDFCGYHYPETREGRPIKDQPEKDGVHDHTMDALRYFAVGEFLQAGGPSATTIPSL
jgi:hypothetical protein